MSTDLENRFSYHPPTAKIAAVHEGVRDTLLSLANDFDELLPDCREKAMVLTKLEETMFWANAAIARNHGSFDRL